MHASEKRLQPGRKILFVCGSLNQTTMMHEISRHLSEYDCYFTPYYADGFIDALARQGFLDFSILGGSFRETTVNYLRENNLRIDCQGGSNNYDLVFTGSDLIVPKNIKNKKLILVQEGMTDPKNLGYYMVKWLRLPRYIASTSTTGLSDAFDVFCVASEGYKKLFVNNGINPDKIEITGIPNYDNCRKYYENDFPYKNFVLVATSDARETFKYENRKKFIEKSLEIANGRHLIFKLHPNEDFDRATREINRWAPEALVFHDGNIHEMIANCDVLITKYSTVVYTGIALGKEVYSYFNLDSLRRMAPIQNGGASAENIASIGESLMHTKSFKKNRQRRRKNAFVLLKKKEKKSQSIFQ